MKRIVAFILVTVLILGNVSFSFADDLSFSDVDNSDWFYSYLTKAIEQNIIQGFADGTFRPNNTVSYGQFITMACLHEGSTKYNEGGYTTTAKHWAMSYYYRGIEEGWFTDKEITVAMLDQPIPRKVMAKITAGMVHISTTDRSRYPDVSDSDPYCQYIMACSGDSKILGGYSNGNFKPEGFLKRSEATKVVVAAKEYIDKRAEAMSGKTPATPELQPGETVIPGINDGRDYSNVSATEGMTDEKKAILDSMLNSLKFGKDSKGYYFSLTRPAVTNSNLNLTINCEIYAFKKSDDPNSSNYDEKQFYYYKNYPVHLADPAAYNAVSHDIKEYITNNTGLAPGYGMDDLNKVLVNFEIKLKDFEKNETGHKQSSRYLVQLWPNEKVVFVDSWVDEKTYKQDVMPLPAGMYNWK